MQVVTLRPGADLDGFRHAVRALVAQGVAPDAVVFAVEDAPALFDDNPRHSGAPQASPEPIHADGVKPGDDGVASSSTTAVMGSGLSPRSPRNDEERKPLTPAPLPPGEGSPLLLPRAVHDLIATVVCHRDPERYALLYRLIWRTLPGERALIDIPSDPLVHRLARMRRASSATCTRCTPFCDSGKSSTTAASISSPGSSPTISSSKRRRSFSSSAFVHCTGRS
jgi:hypothetical protein